MAGDWIDDMLRDYQDSVTRGLYEGVYALSEPQLDRVMQAQARSCVHAFVKLFEIPKDLDLDEFLERMAFGGTSKVSIERKGRTILWKEERHGECMCPLVKRGVVNLKPQLCQCGVHWLRMLVERHTGASVEVELLDSVAKGSDDCVFRITLAG